MAEQASESTAEDKFMSVKKSVFPFLERFSARAGEIKPVRKIDDLEHLLLKLETSPDFSKDARNTYKEVASGAYYWYQFLHGAFIRFTETVKPDENPFYVYLKDVFEETNFDPGLKEIFEAELMPKVISKRFASFESMMMGEYDDTFPVVVFTDFSNGDMQIADNEGGKLPANDLDGYHRVFSAFVTETDHLKYTVKQL
ncbi:hypothetical protein [Roseinatronobacter bogoriensis]|uniref:Uncharacterized protein n=1 Tax=Roseinatronobacter bogoriensis subsp. barguzinensis TaxID=441209 RepID=A0A2K8KDJ5_9RHOB|nr:hypothetical protein [Rhodobaca]ATX67501.1 hypothetical protein BG454_18170 [Rhodobaca barguzinensis]MBB4207094.1 hypothetical protein [Rhodobaca bogoriensis DSM 18756]TDW35975.1 hypothetical protein LY39_02952 [Rhodobaca barguzinensis]TDY73988.1 hypothetical protein EV660_10119 [Rhodobaca bogoriensis DSM 18756]